MKKEIEFYKYVPERTYYPSATDARIVINGDLYVAGVVVLCEDGEYRIRNTKRRNELSLRQMRDAFKKRHG